MGNYLSRRSAEERLEARVAYLEAENASLRTMLGMLASGESNEQLRLMVSASLREGGEKGTAATALQTERERKGHPLVVFERVEK